MPIRRKTTPEDKAEAKKIRESEVEKYLKDRCVAVGGRAMKWTGGNGVPDRIVIVNDCVVFVELKRPYATPRPDQLAQHAKIRRAGGTVYVVDRFEQVDELLDKLTAKKGHKGL